MIGLMSIFIGCLCEFVAFVGIVWVYRLESISFFQYLLVAAKGHERNPSFMLVKTVVGKNRSSSRGMV